jgi:hypothetical protein
MMARTRAALVTAFLVAAASGCDPIKGVRGVVHSAPPCGTSDATREGDPVSGADVSMVCPGQPALPLGQTGTDGRLRYGSLGLWGYDCRIVVAKDGYETQTFLVGELCSAPTPSNDACHYTAFVADLVPATSGR